MKNINIRGKIEFNRILLIANLVIVVVLVYLALSFFLKSTDSENSIDTRLESTENDTGSSLKTANAVNPEIILERDIFNPSKVLSSQNNSQQDTLLANPVTSIARKQLELRLLGTVAGNEEIACAIIEDTKTRIQDLYKTGDIIQGVRIEKIERNRIILLNEGVQEILNLYVASENNTESVALAKETQKTTPDDISAVDIIKITSPTERQVNKSAFLAKIGGIEAILKTVEVTPHVVDGQSDGLQISGLEGLSMARFVGLENGDVIQTINGQVVTDNRKAFQVLRKARALSSLDMELKRGSEQKTLSFKID